MSINNVRTEKVYPEFPSENWPLSSPVLVFGAVFSYILISVKLGPAFMKTRKAYDLRKFLIWYNAAQIVVSVWLVYLNRDGFSTNYIIKNRYDHIFKYPDYLTNGGWWYYLAKISELTDTFIMILRKKQKQISFLHLYHHSSMVVCSYVFMKYFPCDNLVMVCFCNSVVHVAMYSYYFMAGLGPRFHRYLWLKKYITILQLMQFIMGLLGIILTLSLDDEAETTPLYIEIGLVAIFLGLFAHFYWKTYKLPMNVCNTLDLNMEISKKQAAQNIRKTQ